LRLSGVRQIAEFRSPFTINQWAGVIAKFIAVQLKLSLCLIDAYAKIVLNPPQKKNELMAKETNPTPLREEQPSSSLETAGSTDPANAAVDPDTSEPVITPTDSASLEGGNEVPESTGPNSSGIIDATLHSPMISTPPPNPSYAKPKKPLLSRLTVPLLVLAILAVPAVTVYAVFQRAQRTTPSQQSAFRSQNIDLSSLIPTAPASDQGAAGKLTINGTLQVNPGTKPVNPQAGQIYYDQTTHQLGYYNGSGFVYMQGGGTTINKTSVSNVTNVTNTTVVNNYSTSAPAAPPAVLLQVSTPGTVQTGNFNISGTGTMNTATINTGDISTGNIGTINGTTGNITTLNGDTGNISTVNSGTINGTTGNITTLNSDIGNIGVVNTTNIDSGGSGFAINGDRIPTSPAPVVLPVTYSTSNAGITFASTSASFTYTPGTAGEYVIVAVSSSGYSSSMGVTYGGTSMTPLGNVSLDGANYAGELAYFGISNVAARAATITVNNGSGYCVAMATSYTNVSSVSTAQTSHGVFTPSNLNVSQTVATTAPGQMIVQSIAAEASTLTSFSGGTERQQRWYTNSDSLELSDSSTSTTFSGNGAAGAYIWYFPYWGTLAVVLNPSTHNVNTGASNAMLSLSSTGETTFRPTADSTQAFQIQDAAYGDTLLNVDSNTGNIAIGQSSAIYKLDIAGGDVNLSKGYALRFGGDQTLAVSSNGLTTTLGNVNSGGMVAVQGDTFDVQNTSGGTNYLTVNTTTGATTVSGATAFGSTTAHTGAATFGNTVSITGATTLGSTLGVAGAATFGSTTTHTGAATFNGAATLNGTTTLAGATTASGALTATNTFTSKLNSANAFRIQNTSTANLFVADTSNMVITISGSDTSYASLTLNDAHFKTIQTTAPTIATPTNCGAGATAAVAAGSTDTAGSFTITTGTDSTASTCDTTITFHQAYGTAPKSIIIVGKGTTAAAHREIYVPSATTTDFDVSFANSAAGANSTAYEFYYWVIE